MLEQGSEALVELGGDVIDPFEHPVTAEVADRREHLLEARAVAQILQDHGVLGQHLAIGELERGDRALGIDLAIVAPAFGALVAQVHPFGIVAEPELVEQDVRRLRAGARRIIKLHRDPPFGTTARWGSPALATSRPRFDSVPRYGC